MKRILLIAFLTLATFIHAKDFNTFIGAELGSTNLKFDQIDSQRGNTYGIRLGFVKDTGRIYLNLKHAVFDTSSLLSTALNFDAITPRAYRINESFSLRGLIGLHAGFAQINPDNLSKDDGAMGGAKAAILLDFPKNITFELGIDSTWPSLDVGAQSIKDYQDVYLAFDYTF